MFPRQATAIRRRKVKLGVLLVPLAGLEACALCSAGERYSSEVAVEADAVLEVLDEDGSISDQGCRALCDVPNDASNLTCWQDEANDDGTVTVICEWYNPCPRA